MSAVSVEIKIWMGDITSLNVDSIVNAANKSLLGGGGVDGAIHRAAGPELLEETKGLGGAETGEAKITKGYSLPAKYVIHTVGPIYKDGNHDEPELLECSYKNSLAVAEEYKIKSIAFPAISTGIYGYPIDQATEIAIRTVKQQISKLQYLKEITFVVFDEGAFLAYKKAFKNVFGRDINEE